MRFFKRSLQISFQGLILPVAFLIGLGAPVTSFAIALGISDWGDADRFLSDAMQIQISDAGLEFISLNIEEILGRNGLVLRTQQMDFFEQQVPAPIRLDSISAEYLGEKATLADLASELPKWISGVTLNNPQPRIKLVAPRYEVLDGSGGADRAFFQAMPDLAATSRLDSGEMGMGGGVVLALRAHVPILRLSATEVRVSDPRNPDLRESVITQPAVTLGEPGLPLEVRAKVLVRGSSAGRVQVSVLSIDSNIRTVPVHASFAELRVPQIKITVNGHAGFVMNQKALESVLRSKLAGLASIARIRVAAGIRESLPARLEEKFTALIQKQDLGTTELEVPGLTLSSKGQAKSHWLRLGLARAVLSPGWDWKAESDHLRLRFFSEWNSNLSEDELSRALRGLDSSLAPEEESIFDGATLQVDSAAQVIAVLDPRIYNRVLADSWEDGWRYQSDGLKLIDAPQVRLVEASGFSKSFLDAVVMRRPEGWIESQLFGKCGPGVSEDDFRVHAAVELIVRKSKSGGNSIDLLRGGLDLAETFIPAEQFSACALTVMGVFASTDDLRRGILTDQVNASLAETSRMMAAQPQPIVEGLTLPDSLLGMKLRLLRATLENGRVYLQFKLDGVLE